HTALAKRSMAVAASFGLASALSVVVLGDESGYAATQHQRMKLAAMEGMWRTEPAPAGFTIVGFPDREARETHYAIHVPYVLGLISTRSLTREVPGIEELVLESERRVRSGILAYTALNEIRSNPPGETHPALAAQFEENGRNLGYAYLLKRYVDDPASATPEQIEQAAWDTVPAVFPRFWSFRSMVALGFFCILLTGVFVYLSPTRQLAKRRWLLWVAVWSIPLP